MFDILDHEDVEIRRDGGYHLLCVKGRPYFAARSEESLLREDRLEAVERIVSAPEPAAPEPF